MELTEIPICSSMIAAVVVLLLTIIYYMKNRNVLPGPTGVPYLGLYPFLTDKNVHLKLDEYKKIYGDLFSFTYSGRLFINLGSAKAIREIHVTNSQCFTDKYQDFNTITYMLRNGLLTANGEAWKVLRKFFVQRFRDYGLNTVRGDMAGPVYDSINEAVKDLKAANEKPVNVLDLLTQRCTVMMRRVIFGEEGVTDEELREISCAYSAALEGLGGVNLLLMGPFARLIFAVCPKESNALKRHDDLSKIMYSITKKIECAMDGEHSSCMIEDYYKERNERRRNNDPTWKLFTDEALVNTIIQFVGDGIVGVAAFIGGFLNVLIQHPDEQEKLYAELMEVIGPNRQPTVEDKVNLPYVNAFMNEVLRDTTFLNMFPSVECTKETTIRGYRIPKGAITLINFWSAHHDPETYEDPHEFRPSRYMPEPGKPKPESPVSFGMGKRSCSGELFVMTQTFLFLTTIIKNFKILSSSDASNFFDSLIAGKVEMILKPRIDIRLPDA